MDAVECNSFLLSKVKLLCDEKDVSNPIHVVQHVTADHLTLSQKSVAAS